MVKATMIQTVVVIVIVITTALNIDGSTGASARFNYDKTYTYNRHNLEDAYMPDDQDHWYVNTYLPRIVGQRTTQTTVVIVVSWKSVGH